MSKNVKNVESIVQVFTFLHFKIANGHFHCKTITHVMLFIQHYIKTVHFWLKYNGLAIVRKTTKLIEGGQGGHRGLQDYRHIIITSTFFTFLRFFKIQKVVTFYVFLPCFVRFLELCCAPGRYVTVCFCLVYCVVQCIRLIGYRR